MSIRNRCNRRGFFSFDALFSIVPILLMLSFVLGTSSFLAHDAAENVHRQQVFDKVVSIADYAVKAGAARTTAEGLRYPNWLEEGRIDAAFSEDLRKRAGLSKLYISLQEPVERFDVCVYRLVVIGDDKQVARIFVCGG